MEVLIPNPHSMDFDFNSSTARSSPHVSPPSTPKSFGSYYFSAPNSPSHLSNFYADDHDLFDGNPSINDTSTGTGDDFAFDVSHEWDKDNSLSAEELFDGGVIKPPIKPINNEKKASQRRNNPFADAATPQRGRERGVKLSKASSRRAARSLSPLRDEQNVPWIEQQQQQLAVDERQQLRRDDSKDNSLSSSSSSSSVKGHKKWRLKDFFLFRSASEGRASDKDPMKKYTAAVRRSATEDTGSRRKGSVSAHEMHYKVNRAVSEDSKKKTFLPYKQGIFLGRLTYNPAVNALGFSRR